MTSRAQYYGALIGTIAGLIIGLVLLTYNGVI
jgi:hypothetical protein